MNNIKGPLSKDHVFKCLKKFGSMDDEKANKTTETIYQKYSQGVLDDYLNERQFIEGFYDVVDPSKK
jgi:hypothetical protein